VGARRRRALLAAARRVTRIATLLLARGALAAWGCAARRAERARRLQLLIEARAAGRAFAFWAWGTAHAFVRRARPGLPVGPHEMGIGAME
jgi:hypothetical protein